MSIVEALSAVMEDVRSVAKKDRNTHQNFTFRGIDAVVNAVGPALRAHGVVVVPHVDHVEYQDVQTSTGKAANACRVVVTYTFWHGETSLPATVAAEAWDHGDKATPKAMSVAFRTALLQALALPTDEPDPDSHSYERGAQVDLSALWELIGAAKARGITGDFDAMVAYAQESQGHADKAVTQLRKTVAQHDAGGSDGAAGEGSAPAGQEVAP